MAAKAPEVVILSSDEEEKNDNQQEKAGSSRSGYEWGFCGTIFDFESDNSLPNLIVKTFLQDCYHHPKILFHKSFQFFRSYLGELGQSFEMAGDSPWKENHEDYSFCVDKGDERNVELRKRSGYPDKEEKREDDEGEEGNECLTEEEDKSNDYFWANIIPLKRKWTIGLVVLKWEPLPLSLNILEVYVSFCRSKSEVRRDKVVSHDRERTDEYIQDFLEIFDPCRNVEVEERLKGAYAAREYRTTNNLQEPSRSDLQYLFKRQPKSDSKKKKPKRRSILFKPKSRRCQISNHSSSSSDIGDTNSDSDSSPESISSGSEYKCKYSRGHRKSHKRKMDMEQEMRDVVKRLGIKGNIQYPSLRIRPLRFYVNGSTKYPINYAIKMDGLKIRPCTVRLNRIDFPASAPVNGEGSGPTLSSQTTPTLPVSDETRSLQSTDQVNTSLELSIASVSTEVLSTPTDDIELNIPQKAIGEVSANSDDSIKIVKFLRLKDPCNTEVTRKVQRAMAKSMFRCEICWFGTFFTTKQLLDDHMEAMHANKKRNLVTCKCGMRCSKASMDFHLRYCKTKAINCNL